MKKRRLISVMLAGVLATSVTTMAGCFKEYDYDGDEGTRKFSDVYIVVESKDALKGK